MDNKNVFVAIALSMSVLLFWGAFFETPKKSADQNIEKKIEQKDEESAITPTISGISVLIFSINSFAYLFFLTKIITKADRSIKMNGPNHNAYVAGSIGGL